MSEPTEGAPRVRRSTVLLWSVVALWVGLGCASPKTTNTTDSPTSASSTSTSSALAAVPTTADTLPYDPNVSPPPAPVTTASPVTTAAQAPVTTAAPVTTSPPAPVTQMTTLAPTTAPPTTASAVYFPNCKAAKAAGKAPLYRGQPGYRPELDGDSDGIACEK